MNETGENGFEGRYAIYEHAKGEIFIAPNKRILTMILEDRKLPCSKLNVDREYNTIGWIQTRGDFKIRFFGFKSIKQLVRDSFVEAIFEIFENGSNQGV